jgi:phage FluMu gp28-like protein
MEGLATAVADDSDADESALLKRWQGAPEKIVQDVFRTRNMETGEMENLSLFGPYQPQLLHAYFYGDQSIINVYKGRRIGVSFVFCIALCIDAFTTPDANFAIVSRTKSQSEERIADIRTLLKDSKFVEGPVEDWLKKDNNGKLVFPNDATIRAFSGDPKSARGMDSAKTVFVDEMAWLEDQDATMAAFMPFINLGSHRQMLQVSTPRANNDTFLSTNERGSPAGRNGIISVKQPSFKNPEDIDIDTPLHEQDIEPVRPDMDVATVEVERAQDPQGFAQEYLCRPIADEYTFFTTDGIHRAAKRGAARLNDQGEPEGKYIGWSPATHAREGGKMVMGVDIGLDRDDTAIAVFEHSGAKRYLRFHTVLNHQDLHAVGIQSSRVTDPSNVAEYVYRVAENMGVEKVFLDKTGPGAGFQKEVEKRLGRRSSGFNFSDKDEIARMMGDFNYALHNDLITLVPDKAVTSQLEAIVKTQRHETSKPRFSGKDQAPNGKDDMAMALVLGAYPPDYDADRNVEPKQKKNVSGLQDDEPDKTEGSGGGFRQMVQSSGSQKSPSETVREKEPEAKMRAILNSSVGNNRRYQRRHSR